MNFLKERGGEIKGEGGGTILHIKRLSYNSNEAMRLLTTF